MATGVGTARGHDPDPSFLPLLGRKARTARKVAWRLVVSTVGTCMRNRVTGLAGEAAFFALLSLPPLIFGLAGSIGTVFSALDDDQISTLRAEILELARRALTDETVQAIIEPSLDDVFSGPRFQIISVGFILALWSGSRALNVLVDTITIMYGLGGHRGIVRTRMLSFALYALGLVTGVIALPLVVLGPGLIARVIPPDLAFLNALYWPAVLALTTCFLATLYHVSVPVRTSWRTNLPGAVFTLAMWVGGSYVLRWVLTTTAGESTSIYGPLAAPIAVLIWLYVLCIAVLIGAALNAAFDEVWPERAVTLARQELVAAVRRRPVESDASPDDDETGGVPDARIGAQPDDSRP